ncbi:MAG: hypothetical protein ACE37F_03295 [Nannocystaceae bacterium]|nr:hypothetical protein [bacterium]
MRVLDEHCVRCHNPDGLGLGDFTDPQQVADFAELIVASVESDRMPPPVSAPTCRDYVGSASLVLDEGERATLREWTEAGGQAGDALEEGGVSTELSEPDLELLIPAPYTPTYPDPDDAGNEYRCFVLDPGHDEDFFVTALAPIVDQQSMLHHAVLSTASRDTLAPDQLEPSGFDCMGGMGIDPTGGTLVAWAPGMLPVELPDEHGIRVPSDRVLILQIHYFASPGSEGLADRSGYAFRTASTVRTEVQMSQLGVTDFEIPAGAESFTAGGEYSPRTEVEVLGIFPHMHRLGTAFDASVAHADDTEDCLVSGEYSFDNQLTYQFVEPVRVQPDDTLSFSCTWNNSTSNPELDTAPVATTFGERTDEEMCFFFMLTKQIGEEPDGPDVDALDPSALEPGVVHIQVTTEVGGMLVSDDCVGTLEVSTDDPDVLATGACAFEGMFTMLLGTDPQPVTVLGDESGGDVLLQVQESVLEGRWNGSTDGAAVLGSWVAEDTLEIGAAVMVQHAGAFHVER